MAPSGIVRTPVPVPIAPHRGRGFCICGFANRSLKAYALAAGGSRVGCGVKCWCTFLSTQKRLIPKPLTILADAMDTAWATLRESGPRFDGRDVDTRDAIAKYIVDLAKQGERNRQRLIDGALQRFKP